MITDIMQDNELHRLIDRYLSGQATDQEAQTLVRWYRDQLQEDTVWESSNPEVADQVKARMAEKIRLKIQGESSNPSSKVRKLRWGWASAVVAAGLIGALLLFNAWQKKEQSLFLAESPVLTAVNIQQDAEENRFVLLPDSSKVILRPGSKLEYITNFQGKTREVALIGEGYFDIKRDENKSFIVHSGDIRTVVLGTAFTIKADEGQEEVQITVQHGKVRVEKKEKVLAELVA
ncbi:MAG TPA: FecR domain-containing protein, partial [Sphingobacterium sp.]|nr:FecR domain-containing protein [Sphingobacterium sp.]